MGWSLSKIYERLFALLCPPKLSLCGQESWALLERVNILLSANYTNFMSANSPIIFLVTKHYFLDCGSPSSLSHYFNKNTITKHSNYIKNKKNKIFFLLCSKTYGLSYDLFIYTNILYLETWAYNM